MNHFGEADFRNTEDYETDTHIYRWTFLRFVEFLERSGWERVRTDFGMQLMRLEKETPVDDDPGCYYCGPGYCTGSCSW